MRDLGKHLLDLCRDIFHNAKMQVNKQKFWSIKDRYILSLFVKPYEIFEFLVMPSTNNTGKLASI
jgi:hypothetical protein